MEETRVRNEKLNLSDPLDREFVEHCSTPAQPAGYAEPVVERRRSAGQGESLASLDGLNQFGKQCESGFQITPFRSIRFLDLSSCDAAVLVFDHRAGNGLGHRWLSGRRTCAQGTATWARFRACRNRTSPCCAARIDSRFRRRSP
jgi:hypothetical protein